MNTIGWHQDDDDPTISRYWDGTSWQGSLAWNGTAWVAGPMAATDPGTEAPVPPSVPGASHRTPDADVVGTATSGLARLSRPAKIILAGVAVAAVGVLLPWETVSSSIGSTTDGPIDHGGAAILLFGFLAGIVALLWSHREGALAVPRLVGIGVIVAIMLVLGLARMAAIGDAVSQQEAQADPADSSEQGFEFDPSVTAELADMYDQDHAAGMGLLLWGIGGLVGAGGLVDAFVNRGKGSGAAPHANAPAPPNPF